VALLLLVGLVALTALGRLVDFMCYRKKGHKLRIRGWVCAMLIPCYGMLIPGLSACLFSFNIMVDALMIKVGIGADGGVNKFPPTTESMFGLVHLLGTTGSMVGAVAVTIYAVVIPSLKLLLMIVGEGIIFDEEIQVCIQIVQNISKWACPDMFAYILLCYLVRGLNHPPLLLAKMDLDVGFTCFSLFCIGSTIASLGIRVKDRESRTGCWRTIVKQIGLDYLVYVVLALWVAFVVLFVIGILMPVMALQVRLDDLYAPRGPLPLEFMGMPLKPIVDMLGIDKMAAAEVNVVGATGKLWEWALEGEANGFIGLVMMAVFVIFVTFANMTLLTVSAICLRVGRSARQTMCVSWYLKKLGMLDVMITGVIVVTFCMLMYRKDGIVVSCCRGLAELSAAEVIHYVTYYLVKAAVESVEKQLPYDADTESSSEGTESSNTELEGMCQDPSPGLENAPL